jgi:hypothetical protein
MAIGNVLSIIGRGTVCNFFGKEMEKEYHFSKKLSS